MPKDQLIVIIDMSDFCIIPNDGNSETLHILNKIDLVSKEKDSKDVSINE